MKTITEEDCREFARAHAGQTMEWVHKYAGEFHGLRIVGWGTDYRGLWWVLAEVPIEQRGSIPNALADIRGVVDSYDADAIIGFAPEWFVPLAAKPKLDTSKYPHVCPRSGCGSPAYLGFNSIDCSRAGCGP